MSFTIMSAREAITRFFHAQAAVDVLIEGAFAICGSWALRRIMLAERRTRCS
jgi:hypothetical protein